MCAWFVNQLLGCILSASRCIVISNFIGLGWPYSCTKSCPKMESRETARLGVTAHEQRAVLREDMVLPQGGISLEWKRGNFFFSGLGKSP